jgi:hypothetical protein
MESSAGWGGAPFPGPYRAYNVDPEPWLDSRGVRIARRGDITLDQAAGGRPPQLPTPTLSGLGQIADSSGLDFDFGAEGLPEEPMRDPWTFDPLSPVYLTGVALVGAGVLAIGTLVLKR